MTGAQGLAAGKIYISGKLLDPAPGIDDSAPFICSGFCYEKYYFITTPHYRVTDSENLAKMKDQGRASNVAKISVIRHSGDLQAF